MSHLGLVTHSCWYPSPFGSRPVSTLPRDAPPLPGTRLGLRQPWQLWDPSRVWTPDASSWQLSILNISLVLVLLLSLLGSQAGGPYPGVFLFTNPARMIRPVLQLHSGRREVLGTMEQCFLAVQCPDGGHGGSPGLAYTHREISASEKTRFLDERMEGQGGAGVQKCQLKYPIHTTTQP